MANWTVKESDIKIVARETVEDTNPEVYKERGILLVAHKKYKEAEQELIKACKLSNHAKEYDDIYHYFRLLFYTKSTLREQSRKIFFSGAWALMYGIWIWLGYLLISLNMDWKVSIFYLCMPPLCVIEFIDILIGFKDINDACKIFGLSVHADLRKKVLKKFLQSCFITGIKIVVIFCSISLILSVFLGAKYMGDISYLGWSFLIILISFIRFFIYGSKNNNKKV